MKLRHHHLLAKLLKKPIYLWIFSIFWLLMISWVGYVWNLGNFGLVDETEPLFAEAARQMTVTGDWITPYFNNHTRFDKPPLIYWLMAICYQIFGVNEWGARIPSAMSAIITTCLGFYTLRKYGYPDLANPHPESEANLTDNSLQLWISAFIGSAVIALNPEMIAWGRIGVSDMLLTGCLSCALLAFFLGYTDKKSFSPWYIGLYIFTALAILTKGPVGIVLPALIIGSFLLYLGNFWQVVKEMRLVWGLLLIGLLAIPWYILVIKANGQTYIDSFFGYHNVERFTSVVNQHSAPWYYYFLVVFCTFAPWSIYLPFLLARIQVWKRAIWQRQPRTHQLGLFALFWFLAVFIFFTIAVTKLPSYVLPLMPAGGILTGLGFSSLFNNLATKDKYDTPKIMVVCGWFNAIFFALVAVGLFSNNLWLKLIYDPSMPNLQQRFSQSQLLDNGALIITAMSICTVVLLVTKKRRWLWLNHLIAFMALIIFAVMPAVFLVDEMRQLPIREIAQSIVTLKTSQEPVVMLGLEKPTLVFYTKNPVYFFDKSHLVRTNLRNLTANNNSLKTILIVGTLDKFEEADLTPDKYQIIDKAGAYQLVRISQQVVAKAL